ncbi:TetR/AcrR family transcriptional regulator [Burkholderia sp. Ac-20353]|uniref:TetR/AcrR family transcriptional regulator n=1 Tax=Burkholderia sp. Ac-20353 TaxID=2703894 RepID=UPI00197BE7D0|nr:TetR/AcrR family transcriptional regulator [Burkholderia sp. Ac-20353]MBN3785627.1 TetR/AcrR family transcriptional regulator [Burkholderia sp. Ac-20353]
MSTARSNPDVRTRLVEATIRLLATNGPSEVKARSVSNEAGLSTMGVYNYFGGVPELLRAVADEGLCRLATAFELVPKTDNPLVDLCGMALAHRDVARSNAHLYDLMFGLSIHTRYGPARVGTAPVSSEHSPAFNAAYAQLVDACARLVAAKCVQPADPSHIARQLWGAVHGFVMLELAGHFADVADPPSEVLLPMCNNLIIGLGAARDRVESATSSVIAGRIHTEEFDSAAPPARKRRAT